jgi:hypothetical protein
MQCIAASVDPAADHPISKGREFRQEEAIEVVVIVFTADVV